MASSRLPRSTSTFVAMLGAFAAIFGLLGSKKWIIRDGRNGISRGGSGAPIAMGLKKSLGLRMVPPVLDAIAGRCNDP
jgi:hypothetical protein